MNLSQQSLTTGKTVTELEKINLDRKMRKVEEVRKEEMEKLFGESEKQEIKNG